MLCQFSVKNYKSIRDEITLNMEALNIAEHKETLIEMSDGEVYLPLAAVYGPNGGGKSNVLEAMNILVAKIVRPVEVASDKEEIEYRRKPSVVPFLFAEDTKKSPTEFELFFRTESAEYRYQLHVMRDVVVYESLARRKYNAKRVTTAILFERSSDGEIVLSSDLKKLKISKEISETLPFLSYLGFTYRKNAIIHDIFEWLEKGVRFLNYGNPLQELGIAIAKDEKVKELVLQLIKEMDIDIVDFRVEEKDNSFEVYMTHTVDGLSTEITLQEESSGTQKLFGMLPFIMQSLVFGELLVVDELDAKMHPVLLKYIIQLYSDKNSNQRGAQLVFTSHDLSTMNNQVFRRDEIWFVAKGNSQNSKLYSLVEFKSPNGEIVRNDAKYDKQYLEGKYGADPYLRKIIDWGTVNG